MREHLLFTLHGPLQSWGGVAVGTIRPSDSRPTRSALLGLLAAALGIRRHEEDRLQELDQSCLLALRVDAPGARLVDYHTIQTSREKTKRAPRLRADELGGLLPPGEDLKTILSRREYLVDACFTACFWGATSNFNAAGLVEALRAPRFCLSLGRKSCPPSREMLPEVVLAEDFAQALARRHPPRRLISQLARHAPPESRTRREVHIYVDDGHDARGWTPAMSLLRRDAMDRHDRRQFRQRRETVLKPVAEATRDKTPDTGGAT